MNEKLEVFEKNVEKIDERSEKVDELFYIRNEFGNFVVKEEFKLLLSQVSDVKDMLSDVTTSNNTRINKSNQNLLD